MPVMAIPPHSKAHPSQFVHLFEHFLGSGGLLSLLLARETGFPAGKIASAGLTRVPFLIVCAKGYIDIQIMRDGKPADYRLGERAGVFLSSNTWVWCDHFAAPLYFRITFDTDHTLFGLDAKDYSPIAAEQRAVDGLELYLCPHLPDPGTAAILTRLCKDAAPKPPFDSPWAAALGNTALCELTQLLDRPENIPVAKGQATWLSLKNYLEEHCHLPLNRKNVAEVFGLSPAHVSRLFGMWGTDGFNQTLEKLRLRAACNLLKSSQLTISEIAYSCGFSGPNYFVRVFRTQIGITPGAYRNAVTTVQSKR